MKKNFGETTKRKENGMTLRRIHGGKLAALFIVFFLAAVPLFLQSCGSGGYSNPQSEITGSSVLIDPATLNGWITNGYGIDSFGFNKMVVLDVASATGTTSYTGSGHVPGAFILDPSVDLSASRSDGIGGAYSYTDTNGVTWTDSNTPSMLATRSQMDNLIQRTGIDENTVIVFTTDSGAGNLMNMGRAYFNFRYWGFPKERLKVLDGFNSTYAAAGFALQTTVPPAPPASAYSVCQLTQNTSLRAPLAEMITVAEDNDPKTVVVDARSPNEYNGVAGSTAGPFSGKAGYTKKVAFEGHIRTAVSQNYTTLLAADGRLLSRENLIAQMNAIGADGTTTAYTYCRTSWRAAITFLALDGVLGYPAKIYDGAWIEWGQMADEAKDGALKANSPWRTDTAARSQAITYNKDNSIAVDKINGADSYALRADMVNLTDSIACGGSGDGKGPIAPGY